MADQQDDEAGIGAKRRSKTGVDPAETVDPLVAAQAAKPKLPGPENDNVGAKGTPPTHEFELSYEDDRGHLWTGAFKCHVPTINDAVQIGLTRAHMLNGAPLASIDLDTLAILDIQSHLAVCVDDAPKWLRSVGTFHDVGVLGAVFKEVKGHERRFHGADD